ncbi:MAG: glycosyltransferase family 2 protein [Deltaproteobacteria bacterium]|nr:glycosyltransferase family 2 protein [Deltaproteobacteria bacterium]
MYISIIIPAYNEETRIRKTLNNVIDYLNQKEYSSEIIVVSDGSVDNTKLIVQSFQDKYQNLVFIEYFPNKGKGFAVKQGMAIAKGRFRLFMDADYAVPIEYMTTFLSLINYNYDIVIGSRGLKQSQIEAHQPFIRESAAKIFGLIQRVILRLPIIDTQCGFKLFTKEAAEFLFPKITFDCAYFDAELLYIAYHNKMQIGEIGVRWRHDGETRLPIGIKRTAEIIKKLFYIKASKYTELEDGSHADC